MATIGNLNYNNIAEISRDEAIEMLRQIRLTRRTPVTIKKLRRKATSKKKEKKMPKISSAQAKKLLSMLED